MLNTNFFAGHSFDSMDTTESKELQQRLGLYQVFLKLYEHHRSLLDEILRLENSGSKSLARVSSPYVQGVVLGQQVYLITNLLEGQTQALEQFQDIWTIGRDSSQVTLPIPDKHLSRCHAAIQYDQQKFYLVDLNSSNGTFVNGERVRQRRQLQEGDQIRLASLTINFFVCNTVQVLESVPRAIAHTVRQSPATPSVPTPAKQGSIPATVSATEPKPERVFSPEGTLSFLERNDLSSPTVQPLLDF